MMFLMSYLNKILSQSTYVLQQVYKYLDNQRSELIVKCRHTNKFKIIKFVA